MLYYTRTIYHIILDIFFSIPLINHTHKLNSVHTWNTRRWCTVVPCRIQFHLSHFRVCLLYLLLVSALIPGIQRHYGVERVDSTAAAPVLILPLYIVLSACHVYATHCALWCTQHIYHLYLRACRPTSSLRLSASPLLIISTRKYNIVWMYKWALLVYNEWNANVSRYLRAIVNICLRQPKTQP